MKAMTSFQVDTNDGNSSETEAAGYREQMILKVEAEHRQGQGLQKRTNSREILELRLVL